ncbi:hypothetical protein PVL30_003220 [Lodderomyces elongisporus]|uniref:uncharacterized protein n=1 Tax=Lodderomyces elongisporus TaxID=36914 RepID=UPI0029264F83|nr:uncharacterized protein PVL30_003220 [Lodderomyces elongisporus]WLF79465.1 hypothetical protein PVL30_003220 [Lodderomyces elongisporus]
MTSTYQDPRITALITEHLGYAPLKVIDEVINAMNSITIKGIEAFEKFLLDLHSENKIPQSISKDDIYKGTSKLELLLQNNIDVSFDKYELYCLRNIFSIPPDLVQGGWIRLKHLENVDFTNVKNSHIVKWEYDQQIVNIYARIEEELLTRKVIKLQMIKAEKIIENLKYIKKNLLPLTTLTNQQWKLSDSVVDKKIDDKQSELSEGEKETEKDFENEILEKERLAYEKAAPLRELYNSLQPIEQTLAVLQNELNETIDSVANLSKRLDDDVTKQKIVMRPSSRDKFIENRSRRIMQRLNLVDGLINTTTTTTTTTTNVAGAGAGAGAGNGEKSYGSGSGSRHGIDANTTGSTAKRLVLQNDVGSDMDIDSDIIMEEETTTGGVAKESSDGKALANLRDIAKAM